MWANISQAYCKGVPSSSTILALMRRPVRGSMLVASFDADVPILVCVQGSEWGGNSRNFNASVKGIQLHSVFANHVHSKDVGRGLVHDDEGGVEGLRGVVHSELDDEGTCVWHWGPTGVGDRNGATNSFADCIGCGTT